MTLRIRELHPDEHRLVGSVTMDAYREFFEGREDHDYLAHVGDVAGRAARTTVLVAEDDGEIVGSVTLELDGRTDDEDGALEPDRAHIRMLGVTPGARGRGIGPALMAECEARSRAAGKSAITLHTTERMEAAMRMYRALGYERSGERVLPDGFVLLAFRKRLANG
jgi:ribosomal protein S18 acetylase RimI-like enzyme